MSLTIPHIIQYETLQWAWRLGKEYDDVKEYRDHIAKILAQIADSGQIDFDKLRKELEQGLY